MPDSIYSTIFTPPTPSQYLPIILFHDSLGCTALWRDFPTQLAQATQRTIISYDRLGFGNSAPSPEDLKYDFIESEAQNTFSRILERYQIHDFIALGHSVGGGMALFAASHYKDRCKAVITEAAQAFVEDKTLQGIREAQKNFSSPQQIKRLEKYHGSKAQWVLSSWVNTWLADGFRSWNLDPALSNIACPILSIHGDQDEYGSLLHPLRIIQKSQAPAIQKTLNGCGHIPHREKSQEVLEIVQKFLQSLDEQSPETESPLF